MTPERRHGDLLALFFSDAPEAVRRDADRELAALVAAYPHLRIPIEEHAVEMVARQLTLV